MCGVFGCKDMTYEYMKKLVSFAGKDWSCYKRGDIHPSEQACLITGQDRRLVAEELRWGFPEWQKSQLVINARAESAREKRMFSESVSRRRCVIPASHFYEWDGNRNRSTFTLQHEKPMLLAGCYNMINNEPRFVILTTAANESMIPVHDRMPLILSENEVYDWIMRDDLVDDFLQKESPLLHRYQEFEQLSLF